MVRHGHRPSVAPIRRPDHGPFPDIVPVVHDHVDGLFAVAHELARLLTAVYLGDAGRQRRSGRSRVHDGVHGDPDCDRLGLGARNGEGQGGPTGVARGRGVDQSVQGGVDVRQGGGGERHRGVVDAVAGGEGQSVRLSQCERPGVDGYFDRVGSVEVARQRDGVEQGGGEGEGGVGGRDGRVRDVERDGNGRSDGRGEGE
mmetsp:Transcript_13836/g.26045  ORF Transcript_13836/g.26045 Transcript_13836/m.26045 type:complete len:200 (-) Transcript_13836:355-954(-)